MFSEVPQGSILDPLLFDIDVNGIFGIFVDEAFLSNYANDTVFYSVKKTTFLTNLFLKKKNLRQCYLDGPIQSA